MKSAEMEKGRIFVLSLETGEGLKTQIEGFCKSNGIGCAKVNVLGGIATGSSFVCGPELKDSRETVPIKPLRFTTETPAEFAGVGTVFPDESGEPVLHLHGSLGYGGSSVTGCFRGEAKVWLTLEVVIEELKGNGPFRKHDPVLTVSPLDIRSD